MFSYFCSAAVDGIDASPLTVAVHDGGSNAPGVRFFPSLAFSE